MASNFTATAQFLALSTQTMAAQFREQTATEYVALTSTVSSWTSTFTITPTSTRTSRPTERPLTTSSTTQNSIDSTSDPQAVINVTSANIRSGPGTGFAVVGTAELGTSYPVVGRLADNSWFEITVLGQARWISASVVDISGTVAEVEIVETLSTQQPRAQSTIEQQNNDSFWINYVDLKYDGIGHEQPNSLLKPKLRSDDSGLLSPYIVTKRGYVFYIIVRKPENVTSFTFCPVQAAQASIDIQIEGQTVSVPWSGGAGNSGELGFRLILDGSYSGLSSVTGTRFCVVTDGATQTVYLPITYTDLHLQN